MTALGIAQFTAILSTALALVPGAAHALELPNKIRMTRADYLTTQRIYRGWQFVGIAVIAALVATVWLAWLSGEAAARIAVVMIVGTQVVFWVFTFPVNRRTDNWSRVPEDWMGLRRRWEFSHAVSALLNVVALICVVLVAVRQ
jgi:hypothetical protein